MPTLALVVQASVNQAISASAFRLAQTIVASNKAALKGVFFYGEGVYHALAYTGDSLMLFDWPSLQIPLWICSASAERRGILNPAFDLVGLGQLAELYQNSDQMIVLG